MELLTQQVQNPGTGSLQNVVGQAFQALAQMDGLKAVEGSKRARLVDTRQLAHPEEFDGKEESFLFWRTKVEAFVTSVYPEFESVLSWAEEEDSEITTPILMGGAFGPIAPTEKKVENVEAINTQLRAALPSLCDREAFAIVRSAGRGNGVEAWGKLIRRYDPTTGSRRRTIPRHILNPTKAAKIDDLSAALEFWEEQLRLYESRKRADGSRHTLDEEIKVPLLEHLCPAELEKHLQMNHSRYQSYADVRNEVVLYMESRLGGKMLFHDPMDVGALGK